MEKSPITKQITSDKYIEQYEIEKNVSEMLNSLMHDKSEHPYVYMVQFLSNFVSNDELQKNKISIPGPYPIGRPIVKYPKLDEMSTSLLNKHLNKDIWHLIRHKKTKYGGNINNLTKLFDNSPNDPIGCIITDGDCINTFATLLTPIISNAHSVNLTMTSAFNNFAYDSIEDESLDMTHIELWKKKVMNIILSYSRNISGYSFNQYLSNDKRHTIKKLLMAEINELIDNKILSECDILSYDDDQFECDSILKTIKFPDEWMTRANLKQNWPDHRLIYATKQRDIIILINFIDHFRIYAYNAQPNINIVKSYNLLIQIIKQLDLNLSFENHKGIGYITTDIKQIGAGFTVASEIILNHLQKKPFFNELINGIKYDNYSFFPNTESICLSTLKICKLNNLSQFSFFKEYCNTLLGLLILDNDENNELSLDKISFPHAVNKEDSHYHPLYHLIKKIYEDYYPSLRYKISSQGNNINSLLSYSLCHPNKDFMLLLNDQTEYDSFSELIYQFILHTQGFDIKRYDHIHQPETKSKINEIPPDEYYIRISNVAICIRRNVSNYPFPHYHKNLNEDIEEIFLKAINELKSINEVINYHKLTQETIQLLALKYNVKLIHRDNMIKSKIDSDYPNNRGIMTFDAYENICGVVNDFDHLKICLFLPSTTQKTLDESVINILELCNLFSQYINFKYDMKLGFLTSNPEYVGTAMSIKLELILYTIPYDKVVLYFKDKEFNCTLHSSNKVGYSINLYNRTTIGIAETELYALLLSYITELVKLDNSYNK